jgi:hypothetical protein
MKIRQTSPFDLLADEESVSRFHNLLASVDEEELFEVFHDFMVPADDSDPAIESDETLSTSIPGGLSTNTPPRGRGQ